MTHVLLRRQRPDASKEIGPVWMSVRLMHFNQTVARRRARSVKTLDMQQDGLFDLSRPRPLIIILGEREKENWLARPAATAGNYCNHTVLHCPYLREEEGRIFAFKPSRSKRSSNEYDQEEEEGRRDRGALLIVILARTHGAWAQKSPEKGSRESLENAARRRRRRTALKNPFSSGVHHRYWTLFLSSLPSLKR